MDEQIERVARYLYQNYSAIEPATQPNWLNLHWNAKRYWYDKAREIIMLCAGRIEALAEIERLTDALDRLRALLLKAYQFISPHSDPMGMSNTEMAAEIMRALEQPPQEKT